MTIIFILAVSIAAVAASLVVAEKRYLQFQARERVLLLEEGVLKMAQEASLTGDPLMLISYLKFLVQERSEILYAKLRRSSGEVVLGVETREGILLRRSELPSFEKGNGPASLEMGFSRVAIEAGVREALHRVVREVVAIGAVALCLGILFAFLFARAFARPIQDLARASQEIAQGHFQYTVSVRSRDELGWLAIQFNAMAKKLQELDEMKRDFVSAVTHELRSPLGAVEAFLSLMATDISEDRVEKARWSDYLRRMRANVSRLTHFVNDLLDVSKIERGKMECVLRPVAVAPLAAEVVDFFQARAAEAGVGLRGEFDPGLPEVLADADRLRQVLVNLISNALKFTPQGGRVVVRSRLKVLKETQGGVEVSVSDTGSGIEKKDLERIFEKFEQVEASRDRVAGPKGTGLGLAIVKGIVEQHGGRVWVESQRGVGSTFYFTVRLAAEQHAAARTHAR
ncbi:MAG: HAMP domain-containing protein [Elusimicrobia bacterium]|nr:HAMP domain-containing protein [Elusimicrobiota bacterium]